MLHALPHRHRILPACELGISSQVPATEHILHDEGDSEVPDDEGEVRVCTFEADEPFLFVEMELENVKDAPKFTVKAFVFDPGDRQEFDIRWGGFDNV